MSVQAGNRTNYFQLFLANGTILPDGIEADVAASRLSRRLVTAKLCEDGSGSKAEQSAANRTGAFQMAVFSRKPRRRAKLFHLFDDEYFN